MENHFFKSSTRALKHRNIISIYKLKVRREITTQEAQNTATDKARASVLKLWDRVIHDIIHDRFTSFREGTGKKANFGHNNT